MKCEWKECTIGDLGQIVTGKTPPTKNNEYWGGKVMFVTPKDIQATKHIFKTERYVTSEGKVAVKGVTLPKGSICVSCIGNIGYLGITTEECISNQQINSIIVNDNNDIDFVYYLLKSLWAYFKNYEGQSTALSILNKTQFSKIKVQIPNIGMQKKIASVLKLLDEKIELNNAINNNLAEQIKTICTAWLSDYAPFGGVLPDDWSKTPLSSIADFVSGYSYKGAELTESNIAMATIKNFDRKGGFKLDGYKEIVPSSKLKDTQHAELFDTLVAHTDLTQNAEVIGNAEPVMSKSGYSDIVFSMDLVKVVPKNNHISKFLIAAILQDKKFKAHCLGYVNGTTVLHLSKKALPEYQLYLPDDLSALKPLDELVTALYQQISANIEEITKLEALRDTLLPKLMSGELDVSDTDI